MWRSLEPRYDVATALYQGARPYQEDAVVTDFPFGCETGLAVLADGMGGHAAGDIASKIVVTEVFSELKFQAPNFAGFEAEIPDFLEEAAETANMSVREHAQDNPETAGMGATLLSVVMIENRMYWVSVGDSPLYLMRGRALEQINEDHSFWPQIADQLARGLIDEETARRHPDRNSLTSVILGGPIARLDVRESAFQLHAGDIVVLASDGLQYLEEEVIRSILHHRRAATAQQLAGYLIAALQDEDDPEQDNVAIVVIKVNSDQASARDPVEDDATLPPGAVDVSPPPVVETPIASGEENSFAAARAKIKNRDVARPGAPMPRPVNPFMVRRA